MNKDDELTIELAKNKADEYVIKKELDRAKNDFINFMENNGIEEIKTFNVKEYNKPVKYHKSFKMKLKEFLQKLDKVLNI